MLFYLPKRSVAALNIESSNLGFPRIGENREWKKALESHWAGRLDEKDLVSEMKRIRLKNLRQQQEAGVDRIPVGDFTFYDHMLDMAVMFGLIPHRFGHGERPVPLRTYFAMARGDKEQKACEMTKWFNTNYHYIVPEWEKGTEPILLENHPLAAYREAKSQLGIEGKPVFVGPYTFAKLSKGFSPESLPTILEKLTPLYGKILAEMEAEGVEWAQLDEPALVLPHAKEENEAVAAVYGKLAQAAPGIHIMLQTYFGSLEHYEQTLRFPVAGIGLDFRAGREENLHSLSRYGFPKEKVLGLGVLDGRNVWRANLPCELDFLQEELANHVTCRAWWIQPSCSLLHVPVSVERESDLPSILKQSLSFAEEKLDEVVLLTRALREGREGMADCLSASSSALECLARSPWRTQKSVREATRRVTDADTRRPTPYPERRKIQEQRFALPLFPTTTIGSLPQTKEVRRARRAWRQKEWSDERYKEFLQQEIQDWISLQEQIGLDVLVHGEFERTDMVEFFGEKLEGFAVTRQGWVQSYGSRCVKPPILFGDVAFRKPMTVEETLYAQSLTPKPVKGMLTGPITILNWSFVREDLPRPEVARQVALALQKEVKLLEESGIAIIQMDEPALREGLPLKTREWDTYLEWAVAAFRLAVAGAEPATQIHTHMCYSEFHDILDAIRALDADVISIETSRSHGELIEAFEGDCYDQGIGLGVYDIHSPRTPSSEEMVGLVHRALQVLDPSLFWINPDCGLKTRTRKEVIASLRNMVEAAQWMRMEKAKMNRN